eukprot:gb/GEZN01000124.1/.p1 GENE.gb/GEZN01000124.1/~~gb/GEZN01000124.1/.p1  ORF type:complete len:2170 (+),score=315.14 gb/GEZN01000124.1/:144-6653(+)
MDDLAELAELTEESFVSNVKQRFEKDKIYTNVASVLISVNPFKRLPTLYAKDVLTEYFSEELVSKPPHVFAMAKRAYEHALPFHHSGSLRQSVIISGESGAGKTEATKQIIEFLVFASQRQAEQQKSKAHHKADDGVIAQKLILASPILEAFGNAKTLRNKNSSRFGKWLSVIFNKEGVIKSASITKYLLEESRVCYQEGGERNYHVFYQLCAFLNLNPLDFIYLNGDSSTRNGPTPRGNTWGFFSSKSKSKEKDVGICVEVPGVDDQAEFADVSMSFRELGVPQAQIDQIFGVVHAILIMGNITFTVDPKGHSEISEESSQKMLRKTAELLGLDPFVLQNFFIHRVIQSGRGSVITVPRSSEVAVEFRNSLAQQLYSNLFSHLVIILNKSFGEGVPVEGDSSISILDIFGFEVFVVNSFEQFCINFANEKLQHDFIHHMVGMELGIYREEGIEIKMDFSDNSACLQLIEGKPSGILLMLNEELAVPKGSDNNLVMKINKKWSGKSKHYKEIPGQDKFCIVHYAQPVEYTVTGFLHKAKAQNMDEVTAIFAKSSSVYLKSLFEDVQLAENKERVKSQLVHFAKKGSQGSLGENLPSDSKKQKSRPRSKSSVVAHSISDHFQFSLQELIHSIRNSEAHFLRCIKPNAEQVPGGFTEDLVLRQLRTSGLMDAVKVRKQGFSHRLPHEEFIFRYQCLLQFPLEGTMDQIKNIIENSGLNSETKQWAMGTSKVLFRSDLHALLEHKRSVAQLRAVTKIQAQLRTFLVVQDFVMVRKTWQTVQDLLAAAQQEVSSELLNNLTQQAKSLAMMGIGGVLQKEIQHEHERLASIEQVQGQLLSALIEPKFSLISFRESLEGALTVAQVVDLNQNSFAAALIDTVSMLLSQLAVMEAVLVGAIEDSKGSETVLRNCLEDMQPIAMRLQATLMSKLESLSRFKGGFSWTSALENAGQVLEFKEFKDWEAECKRRLSKIAELDERLTTAEALALEPIENFSQVVASATELPTDVLGKFQSRLGIMQQKAAAARRLVSGFTVHCSTVRARISALNAALNDTENRDLEQSGAVLRKAAVTFCQELTVFSKELEQTLEAVATKSTIKKSTQLIKGIDAHCLILLDSHLQVLQRFGPVAASLRQDVLSSVKISLLQESVEALRNLDKRAGIMDELLGLIDATPVFTVEHLNVVEEKLQEAKRELSIDLQTRVAARISLLHKGIATSKTLTNALTAGGDSLSARCLELKQAASVVPVAMEAEFSVSTRNLIQLTRDLAQAYAAFSQQIQTALSQAAKSKSGLEQAQAVLTRCTVLSGAVEAFKKRVAQDETVPPLISAATIQKIVSLHSGTGGLQEVEAGKAELQAFQSMQDRAAVEAVQSMQATAELRTPVSQETVMGYGSQSSMASHAAQPSFTNEALGEYGGQESMGGKAASTANIAESGGKASAASTANIAESGKAARASAASTANIAESRVSVTMQSKQPSAATPRAPPDPITFEGTEGQLQTDLIAGPDILQSISPLPPLTHQAEHALRQSLSPLPPLTPQAEHALLRQPLLETDDSSTDEEPDQKQRRIHLRVKDLLEGSDTDEDLELQTRGSKPNAKDQARAAKAKLRLKNADKEELLLNVAPKTVDEHVRLRKRQKTISAVIGILVLTCTFGIIFFVMSRVSKLEEFSCPQKQFDYIVVGGGASGCALVASLLEKGAIVLLVERGTQDGLSALQPLASQMETLLREDGTRIVSGVGLGGSTLLSEGLYMREDPSSSFFGNVALDLDLVNQSYAWVEQRLKLSSLTTSVDRAQLSASFSELDLLPGSSEMKSLASNSSAQDLLPPKHENLTILTSVRAEKIMFDQSGNVPRAYGVQLQALTSICKIACTCEVRLYEGSSRSEVVLSAGGIYSSHILMLSGVGSKSHLRSKGVSVVADVDGVGRFLDQPALSSYLLSDVVSSQASQRRADVFGYNATKGFSLMGMLRPDNRVQTTERSIGAFLNTSLRNAPATLGRLDQLFEDPRFKSSFRDSLRLYSSVLRPQSMGQLLLSGASWHTPNIVMRGLHDSDRRALTNAMESVIMLEGQYSASPALPWDVFVQSTQAVPICGSGDLDVDIVKTLFPPADRGKLDAFLSCNVLPGWQLWGSNSAILDGTFAVRAVRGLRIVDTSALAVPTSCPPQATLMMFGRYVGAYLFP